MFFFIYLFFLLIQTSASNHVSSSTPSAVSQLETRLEREVQRVEALESSKRILLSQLDNLARRESELRDETSELEKNLAMLRHELKEVTFISFLFSNRT